MTRICLALATLPLWAACDGSETESPASSEGTALVVQCAPLELAPADWRCGEDRTVECQTPEGTAVDVIYVAGEDACDANDFALDDPGPYPTGTHDVTVRRGDEVVCTSTLTVEDTRPPEVAPIQARSFPPNHKWQALTAAECAGAADACDADPTVRFTWATSDEAAEAQGSGHTDPDLRLACDRVEFRAERSGGGDGRVYRFGFEVEDASGNLTAGACSVVIPHDANDGDAADELDDGTAVRVERDCGT